MQKDLRDVCFSDLFALFAFYYELNAVENYDALAFHHIFAKVCKEKVKSKFARNGRISMS